MKQIDENRLESDLEYRFHYLAEFMGFGPEDVGAIHEAAEHLAPRLSDLVERTYQKLLAYDATARHFVPRQSGHGGPVPLNLQELSQGHAQIRFRKDHLMRYFMNLLGRPYDGKMVSYLEMAAKIHTARAGNAAIEVPYVHMNALMGLLNDQLQEMIASLDLPIETMHRTMRAFGKLLWLQNDFIGRNYRERVAS